VRRRTILPILVALALAGSALASSAGTVSTTLTPNRVGKASTLSISATGPFSFTGLPKSAELLVQKGFKASPKSVSVLCSSSQLAANNCPSKSKIGSGTAKATGTLGPFSEQDTIALTLYLGARQQPSDIASVDIIGTDSVFDASLHGSGRLFKSNGQLELLFAQFPNPSNIPQGTKVTLDSLSLTAGASRTVKKGKRAHRHKVHYALIKNPPTCSGNWTGTFTLTFSTGTFTKTLSPACTS
jgi:hypothetical protein